MNREDIVRMAREAGFSVGVGSPALEKHVAFAALIAAAEREACVSIIESHRIPVGNSAAGEMACEWTYDALHEIRDAIRARGVRNDL